MGNEQLKGHLDMLLLQVISDGPAHGYQLASSLRERSEGAFDLSEGTVYPALHRLEHQGLISSDWDHRETRRRRVYRLTPDGRRALAVRRDDWVRFARSIRAVMGATA